MTDRFKFRVWNKHINEYCNIQNLFILPTGETGYFITDGSYPHQRKFIHQEDMIIEMSTGLKDKNGNLIYEGDIVKIPSDWDKYGMMSGAEREVYFFDGGFRLKPKDPHQGRGHWLEDIDGQLEIIGNIHQPREETK